MFFRLTTPAAITPHGASCRDFEVTICVKGKFDSYRFAGDDKLETVSPGYRARIQKVFDDFVLQSPDREAFSSRPPSRAQSAIPFDDADDDSDLSRPLLLRSPSTISNTTLLRRPLARTQSAIPTILGAAAASSSRPPSRAQSAIPFDTDCDSDSSRLLLLRSPSTTPFDTGSSATPSRKALTRTQSAITFDTDPGAASAIGSLSRSPSVLSSIEDFRDVFENPSTIRDLEERIIQAIVENSSEPKLKPTDIKVELTYQTPLKLHKARIKLIRTVLGQVTKKTTVKKTSSTTSYSIPGALAKLEPVDLTEAELKQMKSLELTDNPFEQFEHGPYKTLGMFFGTIVNRTKMYHTAEEAYPVLALPGKLSADAEGSQESVGGNFSIHQIILPDVSCFISKKGFEREIFNLEIRKIYRSFFQSQRESKSTNAIWHPLGSDLLRAIRSEIKNQDQLQAFEDSLQEIEEESIRIFLEEHNRICKDLKVTMCIDRPDLQDYWEKIINPLHSEAPDIGNIVIVSDQNPLKYLESELEKKSLDLCLPILASPFLVPEENLNPDSIYYYQNRLLAQSYFYFLNCLLLNKGFRDNKLHPSDIEIRVDKINRSYKIYYEIGEK